MGQDLQNLILGGTGSIDDRGIRRRTLLFRVENEADCFTEGPAEYLGITQKPGGRSWEPNEAGTAYKLTVQYEGIGDEDPDAEAPHHFEWVPRRSEEPIEAHPLIDKIIKIYGGTPDPETKKITFPRYMPTAPGADGLPGEQGTAGNQRKNPMYGRESYLLKTGIWRWTFSSRSYPQKWEDQDGRVIKSVPGGRRTPAGKNWLVMFEKATPVGTGDAMVYDVQVDFVLSEKGGWPPSATIFDLDA
jgi:hypothetical protein